MKDADHARDYGDDAVVASTLGKAKEPRRMPANTSFFNDLLSTIAERGRSLLDLRRGRQDNDQDVVGLCEAVLSIRGEASGVALAQQIFESYAALDVEGRNGFFDALLERFGPDLDAIDAAIQRFADERSHQAADELARASESRRLELFRRLNLAPGGTASLVHMREDLLRQLKSRRDLELVDRDFAHLFSAWFNRGFLVLRRIDWSTPALILERIIQYEAVHAISDWDDLRRRTDPQDRRCFAFFHPSLVDDPLIFVEVALTAEIPGAIEPILANDRAAIDPGQATTAVFYSISNCQEGLRGISFGHFLIKQVAEELAREFPSIKTFVTLSPIPGFRHWLEQVRDDAASELRLAADEHKALGLIDYDQWVRKPDVVKRLEPVIKFLAAHYLMRAKTTFGRPVDPVARFHLGNGARLDRINWLADTSSKALVESVGLMVNYRYELKDIEHNHEAYADAGEIIASSAVRGLLRADIKSNSETAAR